MKLILVQETLSYSCICSNGASPNASQYSQTIPFYTCTEANNQCVASCGNSECQSNCRTQHPCGAQAPIRVNVSTTTTTAATSAVAAATTTMADVKSTSEATGAAPRLLTVEKGHLYGMCVLVGGMIAGFAVLL